MTGDLDALLDTLDDGRLDDLLDVLDDGSLGELLDDLDGVRVMPERSQNAK